MPDLTKQEPAQEPLKSKSRNKGWDNMRPCKPGETHNPNGRPKKEKCFSDIARTLLGAKKIDIEYTYPKDGKNFTRKMHVESDKPMYHSLVAALIREGMDGNVQAIKELIDRTDGKVTEHLDHTTKGKEVTQNIYNILDASQKETIEEVHRMANSI
jgi:hypothetical protein